MSKQQLEASIALGEKILIGEADLVDLDYRSLEVRGKGKKGSGKASGKMDKAAVEKRKRELDDESKEQMDAKRKRSSSQSPKEGKSSEHPAVERKRASSPSPKEDESKEQPDIKRKRSSSPSPKQEDTSSPPPQALNATKEDLEPWIKKIALSSKTDFQKKVLKALCQVPRGKYSTYGAISKHLSSSPRAVGNALRNNPFAPHVPCHRILASGGGLGGFGGSWGKKGQEGLNDEKKRKLLREEGVRFDGKGMVVGGPWEGFV